MGAEEEVNPKDLTVNISTSTYVERPFGGQTAQEWQKDLFMSWLFQTTIKLQTSLDGRFLQYGMTMQEATVLLRCVEARNNATAGKLAVILGRDKGKVTRVIDRLQRSGLVKREIYRRDKRYTIIKPTKRAKHLAGSFVRVFDSIRAELFLGIPDSDLFVMASMLRLFHKNASNIMSLSKKDPTRLRRRIGVHKKNKQPSAERFWTASQKLLDD
jgi:DNA-binding MarR family transcriptional regulator